jgi:hypothetical protein
MTDKSNVELIGQVKPVKLTSLAEDLKREQGEILANQEHWKTHGTNRRKASSKREIMEELSRERFPWEE